MSTTHRPAPDTPASSRPWEGAASWPPRHRWPTTRSKPLVSIAAGTAASSIALVGFGLDSVVEMSSGLIILWQFRHPDARDP